jgi:hypothetical protein
MIPGDDMPFLVDPGDAALALQQGLSSAGTPGTMIAVCGLVVAVVVLVFALSALEALLGSGGESAA